MTEPCSFLRLFLGVMYFLLHGAMSKNTTQHGVKMHCENSIHFRMHLSSKQQEAKVFVIPAFD